MNKKLISENNAINGCTIRCYSEEFNPQDVKMKYFDYNGDEAKEGDGEEIKTYSFEVDIPGINPLEVRRVVFPEFDYRINGTAKVIVEYEQVFDSNGVYQEQKY